MKKMRYVYELLHKRIDGEPIDGQLVYNSWHLGYFSDREKAETAISQYENLPGFRSYPNNFVIIKLKMNQFLKDFKSEVHS